MYATTLYSDYHFITLTSPQTNTTLLLWRQTTGLRLLLTLLVFSDTKHRD
jgi:cytochrome c-type biogenesis protein CcmH/NrfF